MNKPPPVLLDVRIAICQVRSSAQEDSGHVRHHRACPVSPQFDVLYAGKTTLAHGADGRCDTIRPACKTDPREVFWSLTVSAWVVTYG